MNSLTLTETEMRLDLEAKILWVEFRHETRLAFTVGVLNDLVQIVEFINQLHRENGNLPFTHLILGSKRKGVFNLGGDLDHFARCVVEKDLRALYEYCDLCIHVGHFLQSVKAPMISIILLEGDALGGGLEAALSGQILVAERQAKFGFPEVRFGLFPGMGAWSLGLRKASQEFTTKMIIDGETFVAEELKTQGLIDHVVDEGTARDFVINLIKEQQKHFYSYLSLYRAKAGMANVTYAEMLAIVRDWAHVAMDLSPDQIRKMQVLVQAQNRKILRGS